MQQITHRCIQLVVLKRLINGVLPYSSIREAGILIISLLLGVGLLCSMSPGVESSAFNHSG